MERINVLSMIHREMKRNHFTGVVLARKLNVQPSTIHGLLNHKTIQVQKVAQLSEVFNYNFFREIAALFPYPEPDYSTKPEIDKEKVDMKGRIVEYKDRIKALEMEVGILRQTLKDVVKK